MKSKLFGLFLSSIAILSIVLILSANWLLEKKVEYAYEVPPLLTNLEKSYEVIVIGGEPEGVAAAVAAARQGQDTLLVVKQAELGGLYTYGMLNFLDLTHNDNRENVSTGIFEEWHRLVGGRSSFSIEAAKSAFYMLVKNEPHLDLVTETTVSSIQSDGQAVTGITLNNSNGEHAIATNVLIDATQDGDIATLAGAPYTISGADVGLPDKNMAVTLVMHFTDVDWNGIKKVVNSKKFGYAEISADAAWGFPDILNVYSPIEDNTKLRGLNIAKVNDDIFINALQIFYINGLDEQQKQAAIQAGKRETENVLTFLQQNFEGFEQAKIASFPSELYIRETRHFETEYMLTMTDIWTNATFPDVIGYGAYPVDIQAQSLSDTGYVIADPDQYGVAYRSLVPLEVDNLLIVGRSAGFSSIAAGSARIVPTGMATAEAAGIAAAISNENSISVRQITKDNALIAELQKRLHAEGAYLTDTNSSYPYEGEWYDSAILALMDYGMMVGGYNNDLQVDQLMNTHGFANMLQSIIHRTYLDQEDPTFQRAIQLYQQVIYSDQVPLTKDLVLQSLAVIAQTKPTEQALTDLGLLTGQYAPYLTDGELTKKEAYAYLAEAFNYFTR